jgi:GNAT superfamily N-acetyltransferase
MGLTMNGEPPRRCRRAGSRTLDQMRTAIALSELTSRQFLGQLDTSLAIYADAMDVDPVLLPGRRELMRRHAGYPAFRALRALQVRADQEGAAGLASTTGRRGRASQEDKVIAFAYGFHGQRGQWWYDAVWNALTRTIGAARTADWLANCLEIAEVHVRKPYQRGGIGTQMLTVLTTGRPERTALLSTPDRDSTARRLYRRMGFAELVTGYSFPGGSPPYVVMGAELPLRDPAPVPLPAVARPSIS